MSDSGFRINGLRVTNASLPPADAEFAHPLTVVSGASDTGKTYMMQCINFMLGSGRKPKDIDAARAYSTAFLEIQNSYGEVFTLKRALRGGDFLKYDAARDDIQSDDEPSRLGAKHDSKKEDNVSRLFLTLSDLDGRLVRKNAAGGTRSLSFRDISHLFCIDEERILSSHSAVVSGQYISRTVEESVFRMLLTGQDDSAVVAAPDLKTGAGTEARAKLLDELIEQARADIEDITENPEQVVSELAEVEQVIDSLSASVSDNRSLVREVQQRRQGLWEGMQKHRSRQIVISELLDRLELLSRQYATDRNRLETVLEANHYFAQMAEELCPLCGSDPAERGDRKAAAYDAGQLVEACQQEMRKVELLTADLSQTRQQLREEGESLAARVAALSTNYQEASNQLAEQLRPAGAVHQKRLQEVLSRRQRLERVTSLREQIESLERRKLNLDAPIDGNAEMGFQRGVSAAQAHEFCKQVERLLKTWGFPTGGAVSWSEDNQDIVIDGIDRASHGKGLRAISHAAFSVGLMRYCKAKDLPHPGIVVLDSPLVTYREPDTPPNEKVSPGLKDAFYRSLAKGEDEQVIVFENLDPPEDLRDTISFIHFSKSPSIGRYGFFPHRPQLPGKRKREQ